MKKIILLSLILATLVWAQQRAMTVEDLWAMKRIGEISLSPDGRYLAYGLTAYDMEKNSGNSDLWLVSTTTGDSRQLTFSAKYDGAPRWQPDGSGLAFISSRDGSRQIYYLSLAGGEAKPMTCLAVDVDDFCWLPNANGFLFTASVYSDAKTLAETGQRLQVQEESKVKAHSSDQLLFRVFDHWTEGLVSHVFTCDLQGENVNDLTPGAYSTPPPDLGGQRDFCLAPDGREMAFVRNTDQVNAISTNNDILLSALPGNRVETLTKQNKACDNQPCYSPDGRYLAYKAMRRPGFEADRFEIMLYDRAARQTRSLTAALDRSVNETVWSSDSKRIFFTADQEARVAVFSVELATLQITEWIKDHVNGSLTPSADGRLLYFKQQSTTCPDDIFCMDLTTRQIKQITHVNQLLLEQLALNKAEDFWFTSFDGKRAHGLLVKPPLFDPAKKYPLIYVIHGGPQGMSEDNFHYRWNSSMFAAPGYVVAMVNFRGSTGYGQTWTDAVSKDWGGGPYQDLMTGLDYLVKTYPFIDARRLSAAGGSYGGFMVNWIATHTDRFTALVSHAGVFDQRSMYGATEELWFPEWEMNGTPYENSEMYEKWSPSSFVQNLKKFKTPTLVIHGEGDYRVPYTQGLQMFTALQRMGVPSRLLVYPDETHFVLKPQNSRLWWKEVHGWIAKWTK